MPDKVCPRCGGAITKMEIKENSCFTNHEEKKTMENVCKICSRLANWGVAPHLYESAELFVKNILGLTKPDINDLAEGNMDKLYKFRKACEDAVRCLEWSMERNEEAKEALLGMVPQVRNEEDAPFKGSEGDNRYVVGWNDAGLYYKHLITMNL